MSLEERVRDLAKRAGVDRDVPPAAVIACAVLAAVVIAWAGWRWWPQTDQPVSEVATTATTAERGRPVDSTPTTDAVPVCVHVVGAVRRPGVYRLAAGSRVCDAVDAAGGLLGGAVVEGLNLARVLTDGEQVLVPDEDTNGALAPQVPVGGADAPGAGADGVAKVDLNTADAALLDSLPGVGPSTAEKIIAEREANGPYSSVDDLERVSGIGPKKIEALKDVACVR